ncbi:MAG: sulfite exporter TauE/SafE family protein [Saprospiraceae bacterium]|nr:sulfite exporter TauE/SafE family protein [Saprospiraceae bacterium]
MDFFQQFNLTGFEWAMVVGSALAIGLSKTGLSGLGTMFVPIMAHVFGGKASSGIVLPMLVMADVFAVVYYRRHADWPVLMKLLPWAFVGIVIGTFTSQQIDDEVFKQIMGVIIVVSVAVMIWQETRTEYLIPSHWAFAALMGLAAGYTTMVGNLAGAVTALYLLSMRLPKNNFIGTGAWFYLAINVFKLPFHIFSWKTVTWESFKLDLAVFPVIAAGALLGIVITRYLSEALYRKFIIGMTLATVLLLFW